MALIWLSDGLSMRLGKQVFFPPKGEFDESLLRKRKPVKNRRHLKPEPGLVWTSSLDNTPFGREGWMDWCSHEMPSWIGEQAAIFDVKPSAKILHILNERHLDGLDPRYLRPKEYGDERLDWEAMAQDYDGCHIDPTGNLYMRLYTWDVESTVWFNNSVLTLDRVVDVERKCSIDPDLDMEMTEFSLKLAARRVARRHIAKEGAPPSIQKILDREGLSDLYQWRTYDPIGSGEVEIQIFPKGGGPLSPANLAGFRASPVPERLLRLSSCSEEFKALRRRFGSHLQLWTVESAGLPKEMQRHGIGLAAYEWMLGWAGKFDAVLAPHWCRAGGKTTPDAQRVWQSLGRRYETVGDLVVPRNLR